MERARCRRGPSPRFAQDDRSPHCAVVAARAGRSRVDVACVDARSMLLRVVYALLLRSRIWIESRGHGSCCYQRDEAATAARPSTFRKRRAAAAPLT
jgi:hypothetical protein